MSDIEDDYSSEGDDDYVPTGEVSEGDSDNGDADGQDSGDEEVTGKITTVGKKKKQLKKKLAKSKDQPRKRKGGIQLEEQDKESMDATKDSGSNVEEGITDSVIKEELETIVKEKEKKKADDLWSSFLKDVGPPVKKAKTPVSVVSSSNSVTNKSPGASTKSTSQTAKKEMVTVTKVFDFAGEKVSVTEKVAADSKDAKTFLKTEEKEKASTSQFPFLNKTTASPSTGLKRPSGLSGVLGQIGKKSKLTVLEKSKLDWNNFKSKEGIQEDLTAFVKGKTGYVDQQSFLARADQRQYEQERKIRMAQSKVLR